MAQRTRKKKPEAASQPAYAGRIAQSIAALVNVQSSAELRERVNVIAPEVDALESSISGRTEPEGANEKSETEMVRAVLEPVFFDGLGAVWGATPEEVVACIRGLIERSGAKPRWAMTEEEMLAITDQVADHATARAALEQELDLANRERLAAESQVVDLIAVEGEVIGALRRGGVLRADETPTTVELVALLKKMRGST